MYGEESGCKDPVNQFREECADRLLENEGNKELKSAAKSFMIESTIPKYSYNFTWMGRPIIQYPQDMIAVQEIIWATRPDLIIETGIAHGGSLIFYASILELIGKGEVLGIDIDIRRHNRKEIECHPMYKHIDMIEGSSTSEEVLKKVKMKTADKSAVMVCLDSNHTHDHVARELNLYSPFVTPGAYLVVFDTIIEDIPDNYYPNRPWGKGNNPKTAIFEFLERNDRFIIDRDIDNKLLISVSPNGYLKCIGTTSP